MDSQSCCGLAPGHTGIPEAAEVFALRSVRAFAGSPGFLHPPIASVPVQPEFTGSSGDTAGPLQNSKKQVLLFLRVLFSPSPNPCLVGPLIARHLIEPELLSSNCHRANPVENSKEAVLLFLRVLS
ncbi:hypothetical protein, partial [Arthrobacter sp. ZBG10]|uniref:hypothetical protein n=1 Tax=Arthrobacter sp. ZBG10 TaxID=1676590 RepID=UPI001E2ED160